MSWRPVGLGAGIGAFVLVAALTTELFLDAVGFSLLLGIPAGLLAGALAIMFAYRWTRADASDARIRAVAGASGFGYTTLALRLVTYATDAVDPYLTPSPRVLYAGVAVGLVTALAVPPDRLRGTD